MGSPSRNTPRDFICQKCAFEKYFAYSQTGREAFEIIANIFKGLRDVRRGFEAFSPKRILSVAVFSRPDNRNAISSELQHPEKQAKHFSHHDLVRCAIYIESATEVGRKRNLTLDVRRGLGWLCE